MADAPWKPLAMSFTWGVDPERGERGFTWCSLCGVSCDAGVIAQSLPPDLKGSAFFCRGCCEAMFAASREN